MSHSTLSPDKLPQILKEGAKVIDVRSPAEFKSAHVHGAELHPLDALDPAAFCQSYGSDSPVYILCQSGKRASIAAKKLESAGHRAAIVVEGGTNAAVTAGVEVVRGKGSIAIERQVRIAAGTLVALGTLAGAFLHPGFLAVPTFVGAGLVFSGVTDTCGMALLLAKCPWNQ